ncbi:MAG: zinc-binding alcohol dehydrogenase [Hyphomicrobiaceae bacterium]
MESRAADVVRRSQGQMVVARALWYVKPGVAELRTERLGVPIAGEARVKTIFSAISRGTERLVAFGHVPQSEWQRMRAPMQSGSFPFPVKYGYSATGTVVAGPEHLAGKTVFSLHPHQDFFHAPVEMLVPVPDCVPARRATLAANMETALNAHWDAGTGPGDRVAVIGAGVLGLLTARLARRMPGVRVTLCDIDPAKAALASALDIPFSPPAELKDDNSIVFHTSATSAGLQTALAAAAFEGRIIEASWYGDAPATVHLGGAFHARRLRLISSQVGHVAPSHRPTFSHRKRLETALCLLDDPLLDALVSEEIPFEAVPQQLAAVLSNSSGGLPPLIRYPD